MRSVKKQIFSGSRHIGSRYFSLLMLIVAVLCSTASSGQQCVSITSYGGIGDGKTNNSPSLASAFAALPSTGGCISFPGGRYKFNTAVTLSYPASKAQFALTLVGAGTDATTLYWAASNGITINANGALQTTHVRDLTFSTGSTSGSYSGLILNNSQPLGALGVSDIVRTTFRGDDGGNATEYWGNGISVAGQSNINFEGDNFLGASVGTGGNGILLNGNTSVSPYYGIVFNIANCGFFWTGNGIAIGNYIQGVTVTQSNFTNGLTGINLLPSTSGQFDELNVTAGNQFNTTGNQIITQQFCLHLIVSGNLFFVSPGNSGIFLDSSGLNHTVVNNVFMGNGSSPGFTGIYVSNSNQNTIVSGNSFYNLSQGIDLIGTSGWTVLGNSWATITTNVANVGSNSVGVVTD